MLLVLDPLNLLLLTTVYLLEANWTQRIPRDVGPGAVGVLVENFGRRGHLWTNFLLCQIIFRALARLVPPTAYATHLSPQAGSLVMPEPLAPEAA